MLPQKKPLFTRIQKINSVDIMIFTRQLSTMISAGMPLIHALDSIAQGHKNSSMKIVLLALRSTIAEGSSFADSLSQHPRIFKPLFSQLIRAAENSGTLEIMLKRIADDLEKSAALKRKMIKALTYPAAILVLTLIISLFLMVFIVPEFESLFSSFGATLPPFTRLIIQLSTFTQHHGWLMLGLSIISASALKIVTKHSTRSHYFIDKNLLGIMLLGPLIKKSIIARSSRTLATLLNAGTPLTEALASVANTASNILYQQAFNQIRHRVISGQCLHAAMASISENALFPSEFRQMIRVGEETASLTRMLDKIAEYYEEEVDQTLSNTSQLMEPLIMLILGSIVGCFVVALYMPIFKLGSVF